MPRKKSSQGAAGTVEPAARCQPSSAAAATQMPATLAFKAHVTGNAGAGGGVVASACSPILGWATYARAVQVAGLSALRLEFYCRQHSIEAAFVSTGRCPCWELLPVRPRIEVNPISPKSQSASA